MTAVFPGLAEATYPRHQLHGTERAWPETNCHTDLFIEILSTLGREPAAGLGMTVAQDFEGDQFTFFKMSAADLETLFGIEVLELSIYRPLVDHIEEQVARGRLVLVEVDAHFLADTAGVTYKTGHSKTTIGINRFERDGAKLGYFHNAGYFDAEGADVEAMLGFGSVPTPVLPPYVEFIKVVSPGLTGQALTDAVVARLKGHLARRPDANPVDAYRAAIQRHLDWLGSEPPASFHPYAFNTARQFGANIALLGDHLAWIAGRTSLPLDRAIALCAEMTASAKTFQFLLARALARKRFDALDASLDSMARAYDEAMASIASALGMARAEPAVPLLRQAS
ncbi:DUF1839 family protein [Phreatobacter aquaticus]|uniref:DUF1839 family protein n=1 Tax=Phreatobacter aquaticus TaxID=2570229 RepID=A0A4D7QTH6_9HYPH|nr:DUF1839 family protein [Phreatobacter aquaticus]QCK88524.1 DUF1839 family protein [Phreatobacter aquaticus]